MNSDEFTYSQVIGPTPSKSNTKVETGSNVTYPKDTYTDLYGGKTIDIPWGWISLFLVVIGACVGAYFIVKKN